MLLRTLTFALLLLGFQQTNAQSLQTATLLANSSTILLNGGQGLASNNSAFKHLHNHGDSQRLSITVNYRIGNGYEALGNSSDIYNYLEESAVSLNLRLFNIDNWAFRVGAGYRNIDYTIDNDGVAVDYNGFRRDYTILLGIEKHFNLGNVFTVYPGIVVPIAYIGEDEIENDFAENIDNGDFAASVGVLLGVNMRVFKLLRIGAEFTATYDEFQQKVLANIPNDTNSIKLKNIHYYTDLTLGLAF